MPGTMIQVGGTMGGTSDFFDLNLQPSNSLYGSKLIWMGNI